ncbi:MAG: twin-arginine translocation signal domain-containing protein [Acidobacteriia bacterium]|nr:twin-arginine translocation signal domain-containing protein [Terriglobia bacterium]
MSKAKTGAASRRGFLKGAALGTAALAVKPEAGQAQEQGSARGNATARPNPTTLALDTGARPAVPSRVVENPGSDFMVDVLKTLNIEYAASNPGSTFDGLHESLINYGPNPNSMPEWLTCCHEESAVAMCHGYAKIELKPMMAVIHGTVGLQHAAMAIYNAYADRVPVYMIVGNHADAAARGSGVQSYHSANDMPLLVRDFVKWDDQPISLGAFAESAVRAYKFAMTPPMGPVLLVATHENQTQPNRETNLRIPRYTPTAPPQGDDEAVAQAARWLVAAERPLIVTQRVVRTPNAIKLLTELAETLQAPVDSQERMNFPTRHPLAGTGGAGYEPDVILLLEVSDPTNAARAARARGAKTINVSAMDLFMKSNIQDFGHYADVDLDMGADGEATLPALTEACKKLITADRRRTLQDRGAKLAAAHKLQRNQAVDLAQYGWDASPISLNRLCAELWPLIKNEDWSLVSWQGFISGWPGRLWNFDKHYQYIGGQGGGGIGYNAPASVGAALANKKHGRLSINIQTDGDMNYAPGVLWTAAHHKIPLLTIMHNNRGYHAEVMILQNRASERNRGQDRTTIGTKLWEPNINYAKMAETYGVYGQGPITEPTELVAALKRGIEHVKKGEPALIDVVTQPR